MEFGYEFIIAWTGFLLATYSVMGNDAPAQVLGTLIASHPDKRWRLWVGASILLVAALITSWINYDGGIDFGRLSQIPRPPLEWYYLLGPLGLLVLTRMGTPVSTSFMMLAIFSSGIVLDKIITKSLIGYVLAFAIAFIVWVAVSRGLARYLKNRPNPNMKFWRPVQYGTTGVLWWFWLSHDLANISVFLPRTLSLIELIAVCVIMVASLGLIFRGSGGPVHKFIFRDEGEDMDIRVATLIDAIYALLLFVFKEWSDIPMSTTWVFVGLMGGREMGRAIWARKTRKQARKIVFRRLGALTIGAVISIALVELVMFLR